MLAEKSSHMPGNGERQVQTSCREYVRRGKKGVRTATVTGVGKNKKWWMTIKEKV